MQLHEREEPAATPDDRLSSHHPQPPVAVDAADSVPATSPPTDGMQWDVETETDIDEPGYMMGVAGRRIRCVEYVGSSLIEDALEAASPFADLDELARFIGRFWGWRNTTPTHLGMSTDGVGWHLVDSINLIENDKMRALVPSLTTIWGTDRADMLAMALEAAGLAVIPIDRLAA